MASSGTIAVWPSVSWVDGYSDMIDIDLYVVSGVDYFALFAYIPIGYAILVLVLSQYHVVIALHLSSCAFLEFE
jgi:hypothetical protein